MRITFDEYFEIKDPNAILISPPPVETPKITVAGKQLRIVFKEPLRENTTYTLQLFDAIHDINETNVLPAYQLSFSTGNEIDTSYISGKVQNNFTGELNKGYTVALFHPSINQYPDSTIYPIYLSKCLENGSFYIPSIKNQSYTIYAFDDINNNKRIDQGENMGYIDGNVLAMDTILIKTAKNSPIAPLIYTTPIVLDKKSFIIPLKIPKYAKVSITSEHKSFDKSQRLYTKLIHEDSLLVQDYIKSDLDTTLTYYLLNNGAITDTLEIDLPNTTSPYQLFLDKSSTLPNSPIVLNSLHVIRDINQKKVKLNINDTIPIAKIGATATYFSANITYPFKEETSYSLIIMDSAIHYMDGTFSRSDTFNIRSPSLNKYGDAAILFSNAKTDSIEVQLLSDMSKPAEYTLRTRSDSVFFKGIPTGNYHIRLVYLSDTLRPDYLIPFKQQVSKVFINPTDISIRGGWTIGDFILNNEDE